MRLVFLCSLYCYAVVRHALGPMFEIEALT